MTQTKKTPTSSMNPQHTSQPSTSSLPPVERKSSPVNLNIPTAQFITESPEKAKYQLGSTEFGYGSIHLYRDFEEASAAKKPNDDSSTISSNQKNPEKSSSRKDSLGSDHLSQWKQLDDEHGMIVGVLAIPSYMTSQGKTISISIKKRKVRFADSPYFFFSDFLAFISSVVESIESVRMLRLG
jgi:hypothetical protein